MSSISNNNNNNSNLLVDELRQKLDEYELPVKFQQQAVSAKDTSTNNTNELLQSYKNARKLYLQRKLQHGLTSQILTRYQPDSQTFDLPENCPSLEERANLEQRRQNVFHNITSKAEHIQKQLYQIHAKHTQYIQRREEFENMWNVVVQQNENDDNNMMVDDNDQQQQKQEAEMAEQDEKIAELQKRRAALQVELQNVKQQNDLQAQKLQSYKDKGIEKENISILLQENDITLVQENPHQKLQELQTTNTKLQLHAEKVEEIHNYYNNMKSLLEELSGIRLVSVTTPTTPSENDADMLMKIQLLNKYDVDILLKTETRNSLSIVSAKFVSNNTIITGPTTMDDNNEGNNDASPPPPPVQLAIPKLDDFVELANSNSTQLLFVNGSPGDNLRFLVRETIARITCIEERVNELTILQNEIPATKIGKLHTSSNNGGLEDQEIVCSWNDAQITVVIRLTPDCPLVDGSVYIDQLLGLGGWDTIVIENIRTTLSNRKYKSPVQIWHALQTEILRLQEENGLQFPQTPKLPGTTTMESAW